MHYMWPGAMISAASPSKHRGIPLVCRAIGPYGTSKLAALGVAEALHSELRCVTRNSKSAHHPTKKHLGWYLEFEFRVTQGGWGRGSNRASCALVGPPLCLFRCRVLALAAGDSCSWADGAAVMSSHFMSLWSPPRAVTVCFPPECQQPHSCGVSIRHTK